MSILSSETIAAALTRMSELASDGRLEGIKRTEDKIFIYGRAPALSIADGDAKLVNPPAGIGRCGDPSCLICRGGGGAHSEECTCEMCFTVRRSRVDKKILALAPHNAIVAAFLGTYLRGALSLGGMMAGVIEAMVEQNMRLEKMLLDAAALRPRPIFMEFELIDTVNAESIERMRWSPVIDRYMSVLARRRIDRVGVRDASGLLPDLDEPLVAPARGIATISNPSLGSWVDERFADKPTDRISDADMAEAERRIEAKFLGVDGDDAAGLVPLRPSKPAPKEDPPYVPTRWIGGE